MKKCKKQRIKQAVAVFLSAVMLTSCSSVAFDAAVNSPNEAYSELFLNVQNLCLGENETYRLRVNKTASFGSTDADVASVDSTGKITANSIGTTVILVESYEQRAECYVEVKSAPESVSLNKTSLALGIGETFDLNSSLPAGTASRVVKYSSDNPEVAEVKEAGGLVTAMSEGTATITATTFNGKTATCEVTAKPAPESVSLNKTSLTLGIGETFDLNSSLPAGTASRVVKYSSDNPEVAEVKEAGGLVTAMSEGTATITATTFNGKTATCEVTAKPAPESVSLNKTSLTLGIGETFDLNSSLPAGTASRVVKYSSDNPEVAEVKEAGGLVTAMSEGTATITATTFNGKTAACEVTAKPAPESVSLNKTSLTLGIGETFDLNSSLPAGTASRVVKYSSDNPEVAEVKEAGGLVTAMSEGTATITATTFNGKTATCEVTAKPAPESVSLNKTSLTLGIGETFDLNSSLPAGTASRVVKYSSDNPEVAEVKEAGGLVTAMSEGTATITATTFNGKTATCEVTAKPVPESVSLNKTSLTLGIGETFDLNSSLPAGTASRVVKYSSDNPKVAEVKEAGGLVTAMSEGTATITATTFNGKTAACEVTAKPAPESILLNLSDITIGVGEKISLIGSLSPEDSASYSIVYSSDNPNVASIDSTSGVVTAKSAGTATVTVTAYNGVSASCNVTVSEPTNPADEPIDEGPASITLNETNMTMIKDESFALKQVVSKGESEYNLTFTSDNPEVAEVDASSGVVKAVAKGKATITAAAPNGVTAACTVNVGEVQKYWVVDTPAYTYDEPIYEVLYICNNSKALFDEFNVLSEAHFCQYPYGIDGIDDYVCPGYSSKCVINGRKSVSVGEEGHWEEVVMYDGMELQWVVDEPEHTEEQPVYEYKNICLGCGETFNSSGYTESSVVRHVQAHERAEEEYHFEYEPVLTGTKTVTVPEQGHWEIAVTEDADLVWVIDEPEHEEEQPVYEYWHVCDNCGEAIGNTWSNKPFINHRDLKCNDGEYFSITYTKLQVGTETVTVPEKGHWEPAANFVKPVSITLNETNITMIKDESFALKQVVSKGESECNLTFTSDNPEVAEVDASSGVVKAVAKGKATITAAAPNGITAACTVNVGEVQKYRVVDTPAYTYDEPVYECLPFCETCNFNTREHDFCHYYTGQSYKYPNDYGYIYSAFFDYYVISEIKQVNVGEEGHWEEVVMYDGMELQWVVDEPEHTEERSVYEYRNICLGCGETFKSDTDYYTIERHVNAHEKAGEEFRFEYEPVLTSTYTATVPEQGHWEIAVTEDADLVWVIDEPEHEEEQPVYEYRHVCNECGEAISNTWSSKPFIAHFAHCFNTELGYTYTKLQVGTETVTVPEKGHWEPAANFVKPVSITLNETNITMIKDESFALKQVVSKGESECNLTFTSDNPEVAEVDASSGVVKAVAKGKATITAAAPNGVTAACTVNVGEVQKYWVVDTPAYTYDEPVYECLPFCETCNFNTREHDFCHYYTGQSYTYPDDYGYIYSVFCDYYVISEIKQVNVGEEGHWEEVVMYDGMELQWVVDEPEHTEERSVYEYRNICLGCGEAFKSDTDYYTIERHVNAHEKAGEEFCFEYEPVLTSTYTATVPEQGHWEIAVTEDADLVWVIDEPEHEEEQPVYEYRHVCNKCGEAISNTWSSKPFMAHFAPCFNAGYTYTKLQVGTETITVPEKGHWEPAA